MVQKARIFRLCLALCIITLPQLGRSPQLCAAQPVGILEPLPGTLVILGDDELSEDVRDRFIRLAGGKEAKIVVLQMGGPDSDGEELPEIWKDKEVASMTLLRMGDRENFSQPIGQATGLWVDDGREKELIDLIQGTNVEDALHALFQRGGVIGTTSAGASAICDLAAGGENSQIEFRKGLGLLPGFIIEPHFLRRNRANHLMAALAKKPGYAGLGIDEGAALVIKGRQISTMGRSYVTVFQNPSSRRPPEFRFLKRGDRADLVATSRAAIARGGPMFPPEELAPPGVESGSLIIGGGGGMPRRAWRRFIELAGGPDSPIVVIPTALPDPLSPQSGGVQALKRMGAKNVKLIHTRSRAEADSPEFAAQLEGVRGVWFSGGRQWRFVDAYENTATERAFHEVLKRGGVIGGSSAGASIQSEYMPRGDPLGNLNIIAEGYERGFSFLRGAAVDQHFFARGRLKDMSFLMKQYPQLTGIGIDESTVAVVQGSIMEVVGRSRIAVYHRSVMAQGDQDYEVVGPGQKYDLAERKMLND